jgi:hypothetical protein
MVAVIKASRDACMNVYWLLCGLWQTVVIGWPGVVHCYFGAVDTSGSGT